MTLSRTNIVLALSVGILFAMTAFSGTDYSKPNIEVLPDMKYTPAYNAFSENPNFPNGRTLQEPVRGTIARGELPIHFQATKEDAIRAGEEMLNPYRVPMTNRTETVPASQDSTLTEEESAAANTPSLVKAVVDQASMAQARLEASVQRGTDVYRVYCMTCHGATGSGDGQVTKRGFPPPPSMLTGKSLQMKDGQLFHILTYGQGSMSPFAAQLSRAQRWDVINYVRKLQTQASAQPMSQPNGAVTDSSDESPDGGENDFSPNANPQNHEPAPETDQPTIEPTDASHRDPVLKRSRNRQDLSANPRTRATRMGGSV